MPSNSLSLLSLNVNGLRNKLHEVEDKLQTENPDLVCLTETKLNVSIPNQTIEIEGYDFLRLDRSKGKGGGLVLYHKKHLKTSFSENPLCKLTSCEYIEVEIQLSIRKKLKLILIYRPPKSNKQSFLGTLETSLHKLMDHKTSFCLVGDINIDLNDCTASEEKLAYINMLTSFNCRQIVNFPTRICQSRASLLDHIVLSEDLLCNSVKAVPCPFTDHEGILFNSNLYPETQRHSFVTFRSFKDFNEDTFNELLQNQDWTTFLQETQPDRAWEIFQENFSTTLNACAPLRTIRIKNKYKVSPWLNQDIKKVMVLRDRFYNKAKEKMDPDSWTVYRLIKNRVNYLVRKAKQDYFKYQFEAHDDSKGIWKTVNKLSKGSPSSKHTTTHISPECFAAQFSQAACPVTSQHRTTFYDFLGPQVDHLFEFHSISQEEVASRIRKLQVRKACGEDGISNRLLKCSVRITTPLLTHIFNLCLRTGTMPLSWKSARVVPVHKKGSKFDPKNYRPISLLSCVAKLYEHFLSQQMKEHLSTYDILTKKQHGFRTGFSTNTALITLTDFLYKALDNHKYSAGVFLDLSKAFDTIDHTVLLEKLKWYGFRGHSNAILSDYLQNRKFHVILNNKKSVEHPVVSGVPQGSILGPLLFIIYTNDIENAISYSDCLLYADDTALYHSHRDVDELMVRCQSDVNDLALWFSCNKLKLNADKTQFIIFGTRTSLRRLKTHNLILSIKDCRVHRADSITYLGVKLDECMSWDRQVDHVTKSISKAIGRLCVIKHLIPISVRKRIFPSLILPHITYCCSAWGGTSNSNILKLQRIINRFCRITLDIRNIRYPTRNLLREMDLLPVQQLHEYHTACDMFRFLSSSAELVNFPPLHRHLHNYPTRRGEDFNIPRTNIVIASSAFSSIGPKIWNSIPTEIRLSPSLNSFKQKLVTHLKESVQ